MINVIQDKHLNMDAIIMETDLLKITVLPSMGFKMASLIYKPKDKELLFQPSKKFYELPSFGARFEEYDTSGLDEMIPTIDECEYPLGDYKGTKLPDHGDVWSVPWDVKYINEKLLGKVKLKSLPLEFYKCISFEDDSSIRIEYKVKNLVDEEIYFLWALHGLNVFDDDTTLIIPSEAKNIVNVHENDVFGQVGRKLIFPIAKDVNGNKIDLLKLKNYADNQAYKYYFLNPLTKGEIGLFYGKEKIKYLIKYDPEEIPYLGIWITKGGFKKEYNCAIEPSTGFYDSLDLAYENRKLTKLDPKEERHWNLQIKIEEVE